MAVPRIDTFQSWLHDVWKRIKSETPTLDALESGKPQKVAECAKRKYNEVSMRRMIPFDNPFDVFHVHVNSSSVEMIGIRVGPRGGHPTYQQEGNGKIRTDIRCQYY